MRILFLILLIFLLPLTAQAQLMQFGGNHDSSEPIEISADNLQVNQDNQTAVFSGKVEAIQGEMRLKADKMTVFYATGAKKTAGQNAISKIQVDSNVFLATRKETAAGNNGVYDVNANTIRLQGKVVITQGENVVKGDSLVYNMKTGKSQISSGSASGTPGGGRVKGVFVPQKQ